jgi:hypothetical protein
MKKVWTRLVNEQALDLVHDVYHYRLELLGWHVWLAEELVVQVDGFPDLALISLDSPCFFEIRRKRVTEKRKDLQDGNHYTLPPQLGQNAAVGGIAVPQLMQKRPRGATAGGAAVGA